MPRRRSRTWCRGFVATTTTAGRRRSSPAASSTRSGWRARSIGLDPSQPVVLLAVTSALLRLIDADGALGRWPLPPESLIVDTGGCKGYRTPLARGEIIGRYRDAFAVTADQIVNEYGMTEMCSQLYARGERPLSAPPWVRTLVCDPLTGEEQPPGRPGVLRHVDLANVGSVIAIQTEDVGRAVDGGIELIGRAAGAEARGCSLLASA